MVNHSSVALRFMVTDRAQKIPVTYTGLLEVVKTLGRYWLEIVELPMDSKRI